MKPKCDCHYHERQVCNICQGVDPSKPALDRMTHEEVKEAVRVLLHVRAKPGEAPIEFANRYQAEIEKIEARGWRLGLSLSVHTQTKTSRGHWMLKKPKTVFNVVYAFYDRNNIATKVIFHVSECRTKREALARIGKCPAPTYKQLEFAKSTPAACWQPGD